MKKSVFLGVLVLCAFTNSKEGSWFSGKIVYHNTFKALAWEDISAKLTPVFGSDDPYYISDNNHKMYTEKNQLVKLYTGATNQFCFSWVAKPRPCWTRPPARRERW